MKVCVVQTETRTRFHFYSLKRFIIVSKCKNVNSYILIISVFYLPSLRHIFPALYILFMCYCSCHDYGQSLCSKRWKIKINNLRMKLNILLSRWLSRWILRVTSEEIKLKFRQLEKCKLKNIKEKSHLVFKETCPQQAPGSGLYPT